MDLKRPSDRIINIDKKEKLNILLTRQRKDLVDMLEKLDLVASNLQRSLVEKKIRNARIIIEVNKVKHELDIQSNALKCPLTPLDLNSDGIDLETESLNMNLHDIQSINQDLRRLKLQMIAIQDVFKFRVPVPMRPAMPIDLLLKIENNQLKETVAVFQQLQNLTLQK